MTGLRVVVGLGGVTVDQIEFTVLEGATVVVSPALRPLAAGAPLAGDQDVVIYLPDALADHDVTCRARGLSLAATQGTDAKTVTVARGRIVEVRLTLGQPDASVDAPPGANGSACTGHAECTSGVCANDVCCDRLCGDICQACNVPGMRGTCSLVPAGSRPPAGSTPCTDQGGCGLDGTCDGKGACRLSPAGTQCGMATCAGSAMVSASACDGMGTCKAGPVVTCVPYLCDASGASPRCPPTCSSSAQCVGGRDCVMGSCGKKLDGAACSVPEECSSGFCADGFCCNAACNAQCVSCGQAGNLGMCKPVAAGTIDPRSICTDAGAASCGTTGACDGKGTCARYLSGTVCLPASCSGTVLTPASTCDGSGACVVGSPLNCHPFACDSGACKPTCAGNADCAPGRPCDLPTMSCGKKGMGQPCTGALECTSSFCVDGVCCGDACTGACRSCALATSPGTCATVANGSADPRGACADMGAASCGTDGTCDGGGGCRKYPPGTVCTPASCTGSTRKFPSTCDATGLCTAGAQVSCSPYQCNGAVCFTACGSDADCVAPNLCVAGLCSLRPKGATCASAAECATGQCTNGTCCEAMTCGACHACNVAGSLGTCAPIAAGDPPQPATNCTDMGAASCATDGRCDGAGACRRYAPGTVCTPATCPAGGSMLNRPATCNSTGMCVSGGTQPCAPYKCDGAAACRTTCGGNGDCQAPVLCAGGSCGRKGLGQPCGAAAECASDYCTNGVCCDASSCSSCKACNIAGQEGSCRDVSAGGADPLLSCAAEPAATCGKNGRCDGNGGCQKHLGGTVCNPATCSGNTLTPASTCNGTGSCIAPAGTTTCSPYACASGACRASCSSSADCATNFTCVGSTCQKRATGALCTLAAHCVSGNCVDGVCCSSPSCPSCRACNVTGFLGTCSNVPAGMVDPRSACQVQPQSGCGQDGKCDGAGACRRYPLGTICVAPSCAGNNLRRGSTCDGMGSCVDRGVVMCNPYSCNPSTASCYSSCTSVSQCCCGSTCLLGACLL